MTHIRYINVINRVNVTETKPVHPHHYLEQMEEKDIIIWHLKEEIARLKKIVTKHFETNKS